MWRHMGPMPVRLDIQGEGIQMKCSDLTDLRGSVQITQATTASVVVGFKFSCNPEGYGLFSENGTADRITIASTDSSLVSSSAINCKGFAEVKMVVITATASTGALALFEMFSYTPNDAMGAIRDQGVAGFGDGINDLSTVYRSDVTVTNGSIQRR